MWSRFTQINPFKCESDSGLIHGSYNQHSDWDEVSGQWDSDTNEIRNGSLDWIGQAP